MNPTPKKHAPVGAVLIALACAVGSTHLHAVVSCEVGSAALNFPPYETFQTTPTDSSGSVQVSCSNMSPTETSGVSVALRIGAGAHGSVTDRKMASGSARLGYGIYSDSLRSQNWGDGIDAPAKSTGYMAAGETKPLNFTLYGRLPPQQNVQAGSYSDVVLITVSP